MKIVKKEFLSDADIRLSYIVELPIFDCEPIHHDYWFPYTLKEAIPELSDYVLCIGGNKNKLSVEQVNCINRNWDFCINNRLDSWGFRYD